jgi:hypothetical protein
VLVALEREAKKNGFCIERVLKEFP